jgi:hypothetical protein
MFFTFESYKISYKGVMPELLQSQHSTGGLLKKSRETQGQAMDQMVTK